MPIVQKLMDKLVAQYGEKKGKQVYYAMEAEGSGPFAPGAKHHDMHEDFAARNGVPPISSKAPSKKKPPASRKRGAKRR